MSLNISNLSLKESYNLTGGFTPAQCEMILDWIANAEGLDDKTDDVTTRFNNQSELEEMLADVERITDNMGDFISSIDGTADDETVSVSEVTGAIREYIQELDYIWKDLNRISAEYERDTDVLHEAIEEVRDLIGDMTC